MDPKKFQKHIEQVIYFPDRRYDRDHQLEEVARPLPREKTCEDCHKTVKNRVVVYEVKFDRKKTYWQKKCLICREKITVSGKITK